MRILVTSTGYLYFDNSTLGEVHRRNLPELIADSTRSAGFQVQATELNLVESHAAPAAITDTLVRTLKTMVGHEGVLPWIGEILQLAARALTEGKTHTSLPLHSLETLEPGETRDDLRRRVNAFRKKTDESHRQLHAKARPHLQRLLKAKGIRPAWIDFPQFLEVWEHLDVRETFARQTWRDLHIEEPFLPAVLDASETWRLLSDADAIALFQGAIAFEQPRQVQRMDQLWLPYLGGSDRRVLVTRDGPFAEAAKAVVNGRYHLAQVLTLTEFLDKIGVE